VDPSLSTAWFGGFARSLFSSSSFSTSYRGGAGAAPNLGDARAIHGAIAKGAQAVVDGKLDYKQASILGYDLQLALSNIGRVDVEEEPET
jgi:hypothetical protein